VLKARSPHHRSQSDLRTRSSDAQHVGQQTEQCLSAHQERRDFKGVIVGWLPTDFHTLMYAVMTLSCLIYGLRTGNTAVLVALWSATAGRVGIETGKDLIQKIKEPSVKTMGIRRSSKIE